MENLNQENNTPTTPKSNDQVQLEIETVTPESEKEVNQVSVNDTQERQEETVNKNENSTRAKEPNVKDGNEVTEGKDGNSDEGDKIETISP